MAMTIQRAYQNLRTGEAVFRTRLDELQRTYAAAVGFGGWFLAASRGH